MNAAKVLIIEDNIVTLGDLEMLIGKIGCKNIETAVTGEEAIAISETFKPDLILSDINLGSGLSGIEAVQQIKKEMDVPVIYLTAYDDERTLNEAGITEPYAYLLKPFNERELKISLSIALYKHRAEKELKEAIAVKDRFLSILAHDLRAPFNGIIGFTELLLMDIDESPRDVIKNYVHHIRDSSRETFNLLNNLLEWSRSQQDKIPFNPLNCDINQLVNETFLTLQSNAERKNIALKTEFSSPVKGEVDPDMIKTVLRNLLNNAIKFTPKNGSVTVSAVKETDIVQISVRDSGIGMNRETRETLFTIGESFSRVGTDGEKGSGFGLLLCKDFIDRHKGKIAVKSDEGKGSEFTISLPVIQNREKKLSPPPIDF